MKLAAVILSLVLFTSNVSQNGVAAGYLPFSVIDDLINDYQRYSKLANRPIGGLNSWKIGMLPKRKAAESDANGFMPVFEMVNGKIVQKMVPISGTHFSGFGG